MIFKKTYSFFQEKKSLFFKGSILFIFLLGLIVRSKVFFENRSAFIDEANIFRNIIEKSFLELFAPLDYAQYAPPLWLSIIKIFNTFLGNHEYAFRLFPFICSIFSLYFFYQISKKIIAHKIPVIFTFFLFATSTPLIRYASEAKQYGTDAFLSIVLIYFILQKNRTDLNFKNILFWSLLGSFSIWFSMSSVFILSGIGIYLLLKNRHLIQKNKQYFIPLFILGIIWMFNFSIYYFSILSTDITDHNLQNYHQNYFLPFIPTNSDTLFQWFNIHKEIMKDIIGSTTLALLFGSVFFIIGSFLFIKKKNLIGVLFITPIALCWLASSLGKYSLIPRLTIFYLPISLLIIGWGINYFWDILNTRFKLLISILLLLVASHQWSYRLLWKSLKIEEIKPVLSHIQNHIQEKTDIIYLDYRHVPAFIFYTQYYKYPTYKTLQNYPIVWGEWNTQHPQLSIPLPQNIWLIQPHFTNEERLLFLEHFYELYQLKNTFSYYKISLDVLELKEH